MGEFCEHEPVAACLCCEVSIPVRQILPYPAGSGPVLSSLLPGGWLNTLGMVAYWGLSLLPPYWTLSSNHSWIILNEWKSKLHNLHPCHYSYLVHEPIGQSQGGKGKELTCMCIVGYPILKSADNILWWALTWNTGIWQKSCEWQWVVVFRRII